MDTNDDETEESADPMTLVGQLIHPPWTEKQVRLLTEFQTGGWFHPFTCGKCRGVLVATAAGWVCVEDDYRQDWAHAFMADEQSHATLRRNSPFG